MFGLKFDEKNHVAICYAVVWQHVLGTVGELCAVLGASRTQHSEQYTHRTYDMLPHHHIIHNDVGFFFYRILIETKL